jgi:hypothetical protein
MCYHVSYRVIRSGRGWSRIELEMASGQVVAGETTEMKWRGDVATICGPLPEKGDGVLSHNTIDAWVLIVGNRYMPIAECKKRLPVFQGYCAGPEMVMPEEAA